MTRTQEILLQLLKELDTICRQHDIIYYFIGGSALGAVRHHGFIPWDDDADIVMDYWNYMKFVEVMKDIDLPPNRDYSDPFLPPYTQTNIFGRYSSTDTTQIFDGVAFQEDNNNGVKVDVFMLIPCPDEGAERDSFMRRFHRWSELAHPTARSKQADPEEYRHYASLVQHKGIYPLRTQLFNELDCERYVSASQYLYCYEKFRFFYDKDIFEEPLYFPFEDMLAPVPTKYQRHFRILFGDDWASIPATDEQITHRTTEDLERSYTHYTSDYMRFKQENDFAMRQNYKYHVMKYWEDQKKLDQAYGDLKSCFFQKKFSLYWQRHSQVLEDAYKQYKFKEILDLLQEYTTAQTGTLAQESQMFIQVPERMLYITCASALFSSKTKLARRLLSYIPKDYQSDSLSSLKELLEAKDEIINILEDGGLNTQAESIIDQLLDWYPHDRDLALWKATCLSEQLQSKPFDLVIYNEAQQICLRYQDDGDFLKILGDLAVAIKDLDSAQSYYKQAVLRTDNGLTLQAIEEITDMRVMRPKEIFHG